MATFIVGFIVLAIVVFAVTQIIRDKKSGKTCASCASGGCSKCISSSNGTSKSGQSDTPTLVGCAKCCHKTQVILERLQSEK